MFEDSGANVDLGGNIDLDPSFGTGVTGSWTTVSIWDAVTLQTELCDTGATWSAGELAGCFLNPDSTQTLQYLIVSNSASLMYVWGNLPTNDVAGLSYQVYDYHLPANSPCIDAGTNALSGVGDLDGVSRPLDGNNDGTNTSDMGSYEYAHPGADSDSDGLLDGWEAGTGLDATNAVGDGGPDGDPDGDGMDNLSEYWADTGPTTGNSLLAITDLTVGPGGCDVHWQGGVLATQVLEYCVDLESGLWQPLLTNTPPTPVTTNSIELGATNGPRFYRIRAGR